MKKFPQISKLDSPKLEALKLPKSNLSQVNGGTCSCGTKSMCHVDGVNDADGSNHEYQAQIQ